MKDLAIQRNFAEMSHYRYVQYPDFLLYLFMILVLRTGQVRRGEQSNV